MTRHWEPGVAYSVGEVVEYQGQEYKVIQAHSSQADWAPGVATTALFQSLGSGDHHEPPRECNAPHREHPHVPAHDANPPKSNPFGSRDGWLQDARHRTDQFHRNGPHGPTTWVLVSGHDIPRGAIEAGREGDNTLYISRAYVEDGLYVGKAGKHLIQGAEIGRQHKSYPIHEYEVLIGDPRAIRWVETSGVPNARNLAARPVDAGVDGYGYPIFVTQVDHKGGVHPARASGGGSGAYLVYGNGELVFLEYRVLCYA